METLLTYRGKKITQEAVVFIRGFIAQNPGDSRWRLSQKLCQAWNWQQPNRALRDMVDQDLMLTLQRTGYIELPANLPSLIRTHRSQSTLRRLTEKTQNTPAKLGG